MNLCITSNAKNKEIKRLITLDRFLSPRYNHRVSSAIMRLNQFINNKMPEADLQIQSSDQHRIDIYAGAILIAYYQ